MPESAICIRDISDGEHLGGGHEGSYWLGDSLGGDCDKLSVRGCVDGILRLMGILRITRSRVSVSKRFNFLMFFFRSDY